MGKRTQYIVYKYIHLRDKAFIHPNTFSTFARVFFFQCEKPTVTEHAH